MNHSKNLNSNSSRMGRLAVAIVVAVATLFLLQRGFIFLRDTTASKIVIVLVAILWGVGGVALLFTVANWVVELLPEKWVPRIQPFVFVGPGVALLFWFLAIPVFRTIVLSFRGPNGKGYDGFDNYIFAFTDRIMLEAFRNNLLWNGEVLGQDLVYRLRLHPIYSQYRSDDRYGRVSFVTQ